MDHDDLIKRLIENTDPEDSLSVALIANIRERKRLFNEMISNSRFLKDSCGASSDTRPSGVLH